MAELLKQWHGLLTLKVALSAHPPGPDGNPSPKGTEAGESGRHLPDPHVEFTVERNHQGTALFRHSTLLPLVLTGIPDDPGETAEPPFELSDLVRSLIEGTVAESDPGEPLWLHLVKPYGHLGALPWERELTRLTGHPVLRLPDFLEPPREDKSVLETAIVCDLPLEDQASQLAFRGILKAWLAAPGRDRIRIHVFAAHPLHHAANGLANDPHILFHRPEDLSLDLNAVSDPWQHWVSAAMAGRALDAVHFLCRATLFHGRSCISFSPPVAREGASPLTFVYPAELASGLTQTGAWCVVVGGPADGTSDVALRHFVDAIAQARPGPALYHGFRPETIERELGPAFRTLFNAGSFDVPPFTESFLYCQPELAMPGLQAVPKTELIALDQNADLLEAGHPFTAAMPAAEPVQVPNWVAATQRFAESVALDTKRNCSADVLMSDPFAEPVAASVSATSVSVVQETLGEIQRIVGEYARETLSHESEPRG